MVDSVGSSLPPSVQAVNKARNTAQAQKAERSEAASDEVSISNEAQELAQADRLAAETRDFLIEDQNQTLGRGERLNDLL